MKNSKILIDIFFCSVRLKADKKFSRPEWGGEGYSGDYSPVIVVVL